MGSTNGWKADSSPQIYASPVKAWSLLSLSISFAKEKERCCCKEGNWFNFVAVLSGYPPSPQSHNEASGCFLTDVGICSIHFGGDLMGFPWKAWMSEMEAVDQFNLASAENLCGSKTRSVQPS
jgi:hypothetical protein